MNRDQPNPSPIFAAADRFGDDYAKLLVEQYKLFVDSSNRVSERRASAHTLLMTTNTLIVGVYSIAVGKDVAFRAAGGVWHYVVPLAGLAMALGWSSLIRSYRALNTAKFSVIAQIEERLPVQMFRLEWELLRGQGRVRWLGLTTSEQVVPAVFGALYIMLGVSVVLR